MLSLNNQRCIGTGTWLKAHVTFNVNSELCLRYNWGKPLYQSIPAPMNPDGKQTYLYRVTIMPLGITIQVNTKLNLELPIITFLLFKAPKLSATEQEAKMLAAESTLIQLGFASNETLIANQVRANSQSSKTSILIINVDAYRISNANVCLDWSPQPNCASS